MAGLLAVAAGPVEGLAQTAHPLDVRSSLVDSALALVEREYGTTDMALLTPMPESTLFQAAVPDCALQKPGVCAWPWQYSYFIVLLRFGAFPDTSVSGLVAVPLDSLGRLLPGHQIGGLPPCRTQPRECDFHISADSVIHLATAAGLPVGLAPWMVRFVWGSELRLGNCGPCFGHYITDGRWNTYVWEVKSVEERGQSWQAGTLMVFDANSGVLLLTRPWLWSGDF